MKCPFDGQGIRRYNGIVHVINGASDRRESPSDGWYFYLKCGGRAKYNVINRGPNRLTNETVTCMGCLGS